MKLENTLNNLRKSKNSFFNFNGNEIINFDLCKNKMFINFDCVTYHYRERIEIYKKVFIEKWDLTPLGSFFITKKPVYFYNRNLIPHGHVLSNKLNYMVRGDAKFLMRLCN
jgi:hypothetical protein